MRKPINPDEIRQMAESLMSRYGKQALEIAIQKANDAKLGEFPSEKDIALHVLTQVEILLEQSG